MTHAAAGGIALPPALMRSIADDPEALATSIIRLHEGAAPAAVRVQSELIAERYSHSVVIERLRAAAEGRRARPEGGGFPSRCVGPRPATLVRRLVGWGCRAPVRDQGLGAASGGPILQTRLPLLRPSHSGRDRMVSDLQL
jgi:hypothetical protein